MIKEDVHADIAVRKQILRIYHKLYKLFKELRDNPEILESYGKSILIGKDRGSQEEVYAPEIDLHKIDPSLPSPVYCQIKGFIHGSRGGFHRVENSSYVALYLVRDAFDVYQQIVDFFPRYRDAFVHEMTHYFDHARYKDIEGGERASIKATSDALETGNMRGYYNSPSELNTHYHELMDIVDKSFRTIPKNKRKERFPSFEAFFGYVFNRATADQRVYLKMLSRPNKRKLVKRFYQYYKLMVLDAVQEKAVTANDELFFLDPDETKQQQTSFEEERRFLEKGLFINGHLIEEGTLFSIVGK